ncbi:hypothetical protein CTI12_AA491590 [Artemisia annua]|uniref:Reverse transcriptase zinc-binding domain-containing protein n=1 Tax=Artemisia annua TaxID=35608 RepID=A0A2U1LG09_ARTAN|nr:hypothetical protein CTI12_AA491590 [Artemisia annua]
MDGEDLSLDETNGISWVKWDSVLQSIESGGLGIGSLKAKNVGLIGKWWWRFLNEKNELWCKVISAFHGTDDSFSSGFGLGLHKSGVMNGIWVGNWGWCSSPRGRTLDEVGELSRLIGNLVLSPEQQDGWRWKLNPNVGELSRLIGNLVLSPEQQDGWRWKLNPNGKFTVNNLSKLIDVAILGSNVMSCKVDWNRFVPRKVNIFIWRAVNDRLPTHANLLLRGLPISSSLCPFCGLEEESIHHNILSCSVVSQI